MVPKTRQWLVGAAVAAALAPVVWLGLGHPARPSLAADTAVVQASQEPDTLDPYLSPMAVTSTLATLFYSGLVTLDDHGAWQPDLAERVPTPENGGVRVSGGTMAVTYRLRKQARWHDGKPVTSADLVATWKLVMDPRFPAVSTAGYELISRIETPDAATAVVHFKQPYAPYLELFPYVLPAHAIGPAAEASHAAWNRAPVGSGPYRFAGWLSGERLVAEADAGYFRGKPAIAKLEVRFVPNENTALQLWLSGGADLVQGAPPTQYETFQREAPRQVHLTPTTAWEHVLFNLEHPILKDLRVRRAIAHLIDRQAVNSAAYGGVLVPAWSELPTYHWAYDRVVEDRYPFDPAQAARLLDEAGWKMGPDGLRQRDGQPLKLTLLTTTEKPSRGLAAQIWRRQWRQAGILLEIDKQPGSAVFGPASARGRLATGAYDLALVSGLSRPDPDSAFRWRSDQVPPHGQNRARYRSPAADALLDAGQRTVKVSARRPLYGKLADRLITDLPALPLLYWVDIDATSPRLMGFKPNPTLRGNLWNVWEWKLVNPS